MQKYTAKNPEEIYKSWLKNRDDTEENFIDFVNNLDWRVSQELAAEYQSNFDDVYDRNFAKVIQETWTAFATTGNPDNEFIPHREKYSADNRQTMELNSKGCILHKDFNTQNLNEL